MKSPEHLQRPNEERPGSQVPGRLSAISTCLPACRQPVLEGWPNSRGPLVSRGIEGSLPGFADSPAELMTVVILSHRGLGGGLLCSNRRFAKPDCQQSLSSPPSKYTHTPIATLPTQLPVLTVRLQQPPSRHPLPHLTTRSDSSQILSLRSAFGSLPFTQARSQGQLCDLD